MKALYNLAGFIFTLVALSSCEKVIDLNLKNAAPQLVIEGSITNMPQSPTVRISRSVSFDEPSKFPAVSGAVVKITSSGGAVYTLPETSAGVYQTTPLIGRPGRTYTLQVDVEGQSYKAESTMPNQVFIDSIAVDERSFRDSKNNTIIVYYTDPVAEKNQYHFILDINGVRIKEVFARNDEFNNGRAVRVALYQDDVDIKSGDKIDIEMQGIDERIFTYWFTLGKQSGNGMGNGSVAPANPPNNFDKPVLGYFSAHTLSRKSAIVR